MRWQAVSWPELRRSSVLSGAMACRRRGMPKPVGVVGVPPRYCRDRDAGYTIVHMKTMIDLDDEALAAAARELGTTTKKDTVNAALAFVAARRRRVDQLLDDPYALGLGADIGDPEVMRSARR